MCRGSRQVPYRYRFRYGQPVGYPTQTIAVHHTASRFDDSIAGRLFRYAQGTSSGANVYKLTDGTFTQVEQREYERIVKVYYGGSKNFVSAEEKAELVSAGYGEYIT